MKYLMLVVFAFAATAVSAQSANASKDQTDITKERKWKTAANQVEEGNYARAFYVFQDYHYRYPENGKAAYNLGICLAGMGDPDGIARHEPCYYLHYAQKKGMDVPGGKMQEYGCE